MNEITREPALESLPLGPEQRALIQAGGAGEHVVVTLEFDGALQPDALRQALHAIAARHAVLTHAYAEVPGYLGVRAVPMEPAADLAWEVADLSQSADVNAAFEAMREREQRTPLALAQGRPWRAALCRLGDAQWRLLLSIAALAADRGSRAQLALELARWWRGLRADGADEPPLPYAQYVAWRHDLEQDGDAQAGRDYWQAWTQGANEAGPLRLPYRRAVDAGAPSAVASITAQASAQAADAVLARAGALYAPGEAEGRVPADEVVLQAAWWALLARISGESRYVGGWLHDCRRDYDMLAGAVGRYEKILPLNLAVDLEGGFDALAQGLSAQLDSHREAQEYWPVAEPPVSPRAGFGMLPADVGGSAAGSTWRMEEHGAEAPRFELVLLAGPVQAGAALPLVLHYDPRRLDAVAAARLLEQYRTLLAALADCGPASLASLPLVGPEETQALTAWNAASASVSADTVPRRLQGWAERTPGATALQWSGGALDYAALQARVDAWARCLIAHGVKRGDVVALDLPLSADLVVALLAVMRAGAAYLPLDPAWPPQRRELILEHARPVLRLRPAGASDGGTRSSSTLDFSLAEPAHDAATELPTVGTHDAAYVLYTSGSTGTPKGVVIEHGQLGNYVAASGSALGLSQCRRFGLVASVAADLGNTALFGALCHGAALVVAEPDAVRDPQAFARYVAGYAIDCLKIVPSHLSALLDEPPQGAAIPATLVLGGEATPAALVRALRRAAPRCRIFNHYGPTETTVGVLVHEVPPGPDPEAGAQLPLSRVLDGNTVLVLNAAGDLAATGELGELAIGGAQVCRGYLGVADDARFFQTPLAPGLRLYRSGDLARRLPQGGLVLAGRADHQVKIRGYRVEPAEIEAAVQSLPEVRQAAVRALPDGTGALRLVAYVAGPSDDSAASRLRAALQAILPSHMVPATIVTLPQLPRLPNGKLDPAALPDPDHHADAGLHTAPEGDVETVLAGLIAELLERDAVSVTGDLFEQGADSLMVIKLVARIRRSLQLEVQPGVVFDHPTVRSLAQALTAQEPSPGRLAQVAAARRRLDAMSPAERAALAERGRSAASSGQEAAA
ncbi:non-ribosomal peptide synthetase [Bordetella genomosp. 13]|uniref:non-ribosomal peptide synthetase n=1 Tax=Bordetella genomosp. 13 TaxID=463040 RepID=UPI0018DFBEC1|nr:non-ribosomal peptide synthetase [Bordetella genomosp. 13]